MGWLRKLFGGSKDEDTYSSLRGKALSIGRSAAGLAEPPRDAPAWGLLMETGYEEGSSTLLALSDGTTSLYLSGGGGVIGGQQHESVRRANAQLLRSANLFVGKMAPTGRYPLPAPGQVLFYARTDSGVLTASAPEEALGSGRHELSPLFMSGHGVITALREITEGKAPAGAAAEGDVNRVLDETGLTLLMVAAHEGKEDLLENLLGSGADVEERDEKGYTALMFACNAGQAGAAARLITAGADVNAGDNDGSTPLMFAAQHGHDGVVTLLLEAGADPDRVGDHGLSAIGFAEQNGRSETLRLLRARSRGGH